MTIYYESELYHHGVKGMKWGVHKTSQQRADYHISKIGTSRTRLGKNYHNNRAYIHERDANLSNSFTKSKGVIRKIDSTVGYGYDASRQKAAANYYSRKADYSKTRLGKRVNETRAFNNDSYAKANQRVHDSKNAKEVAQNILKKNYTTPVKTLSGRTTTNGKERCHQMLFGDVASTVKDVKYLAKNRKKK